MSGSVGQPDLVGRLRSCHELWLSVGITGRATSRRPVTRQRHPFTLPRRRTLRTFFWEPLRGSERRDVAVASALRRCPSGPAGAGAISLRSIPAPPSLPPLRYVLANVVIPTRRDTFAPPQGRSCERRYSRASTTEQLRRPLPPSAPFRDCGVASGSHLPAAISVHASTAHGFFCDGWIFQKIQSA
jgi:hypothetical protein